MIYENTTSQWISDSQTKYVTNQSTYLFECSYAMCEVGHLWQAFLKGNHHIGRYIDKQMSCLIYLYRRADREPSAHSRICSCHFRDGEKCFGPEIYARNAEKVFPSTSSKGKAKRSKQCDEATVEEIAQKYRKNATEPGANEETIPINQTILQAELDSTRADLEKERQENVYKKTHYTASKLN